LFSSFLYSTVDRISNSRCAIVMDERVDIMSGPGDAGVKLFQLHEGARAYVIGVDGDWTEIKLENGNVGWLYTSAIEPI
jgi:SH3-like domain-containing protein